MNEHQIEEDWQVSVQSGKEFKAMSAILKEKYEACVRNEADGNLQTDEIDGKNHPYIYMFYTPNKISREIHMPDCDDFIVFHIKKNKLLKCFRLF